MHARMRSCGGVTQRAGVSGTIYQSDPYPKGLLPASVRQGWRRKKRHGAAHEEAKWHRGGWAGLGHALNSKSSSGKRTRRVKRTTCIVIHKRFSNFSQDCYRTLYPLLSVPLAVTERAPQHSPALAGARARQPRAVGFLLMVRVQQAFMYEAPSKGPVLDIPVPDLHPPPPPRARLSEAGAGGRRGVLALGKRLSVLLHMTFLLSLALLHARALCPRTRAPRLEHCFCACTWFVAQRLSPMRFDVDVPSRPTLCL